MERTCLLSPQIIAEAAQVAYKDATTDTQQKTRRVVEVWRARQVFDPSVQDAIEARIDEIDRNRSSTKKPLMGGSLFSSGVPGSLPTQLQPLAPLQIALSKASLASTPAGSTASTEYTKLHNPTTTLPSPPVHAARLSALLKSLANAETALADTIKARSALIDALMKIVGEHRAALIEEENERKTIEERQFLTEAEKREVEDGIMRAFSADSATSVSALPVAGVDGIRRSTPLDAEDPEPERPEIEALTPPPASPLTPPLASMSAAPSSDPYMESVERQEDADVSNLLASMTNANASPVFVASADPRIHSANGIATVTKKRKADPQGVDEFNTVTGMMENHSSNKVNNMNNINEDDVMADLDDDVAELLRQESKRALV